MSAYVEQSSPAGSVPREPVPEARPVPHIPDARPALHLGAPKSATSANNVCAMHALERVARRFNAANIPLLVLKGAALHLTVYEHPAERAMTDVDVMIRPADVPRAFDVLRAAGCVPGPPLLRADFFPRFHYEFGWQVGRILPVKLDVHVRPFRPLRYAYFVPDEALWNGAVPTALGQAAVLVPAPLEMLIHLATHAAVHGAIAERWLRDMQRWLAAYGDEIDWARFIATVRAWRLVLPVREALRQAQLSAGAAVPADVLRELAQSPTNWRDRLALWQAPRDAAHPAGHLLGTLVATPGWRLRFGFAWRVLFPDRAHLAESTDSPRSGAAIVWRWLRASWRLLTGRNALNT